MKISELLNEFEFPDIGGKIYDLTHPKTTTAPTPAPAQPVKPTTPINPTVTTKPPVAPIAKIPVPTEPALFDPAANKPMLVTIAQKSGIKKNDLIGFLGQCSHETLNWTKPVESMMYSKAEQIYKKFTSKFPSIEDAIPYVNNPVALANRAYAGKNGNGDEASGDGWKFRGRGFIHITGRALYQEAGSIAHPENPNIYVNNPYLLSSNPVEAAKATIAYYKKNIGLGKTTSQITRKVNPGGAGKAAREKATNIERQKILGTKPRKK
jgi:putative chitinase